MATMLIMNTFLAISRINFLIVEFGGMKLVSSKRGLSFDQKIRKKWFREWLEAYRPATRTDENLQTAAQSFIELPSAIDMTTLQQE